MDNAPVFIKIDSYKEVLDIIDVLKTKVENVKDLMEEINEVKSEEENEMLEWQRTINSISDKVNDIDKILFEPQL
jgi:predicted DNA-binding ArsR family transcriptional regulator